MPKKKGSKKLSPAEFITIWQRAQSVAEVVRKTRLEVGTVRSRVFYYRRKGVRLKALPHAGYDKSALSWHALAKLAEKEFRP